MGSEESTLLPVTITLSAQVASQLGLRSPGDEAYLSLSRITGSDAIVEVESQETPSQEMPGESVPESMGELGPQAGEMAGLLPPALKRVLGA